MDKIILKDLEFYGYHGVFPEEKKLGQRYQVDVIMGLDLKEAGKEDNLQKTVNYAQVYTGIKNIVEEKIFELIEALAEEIADFVLVDFQRVQWVKVEVRKPQAPIPAIFGHVAVAIKRERE